MAFVDAAVMDMEVQEPAAARGLVVAVPCRVLEDGALVAGRDDPLA